MRAAVKGAGFSLALAIALILAIPGFAQTAEPQSSVSDEAGSVIVFPKFAKGKVSVDGVQRAQTEIKVHLRCPKDLTCTEDEPIKIRFHWVCPGTPRNVCREVGFDVPLSANRTASFGPEDSDTQGNGLAANAPCPRGYLVGWVISPTTDKPIKYDGLTGAAVLRDDQGATQSYQAIAIKADPNLAPLAEIASEIDPRTGIPALAFDGGAGHYQSVVGAVPTNLEYHKLGGPLSSNDEAFLVLLTLDVRVGRPNYPTFVDLNYLTDQGNRVSTSWHFTCWTEIHKPNINADLTLAGARIRNGVVLSGQAMKVPTGDVSDIPGPVPLLGLVPSEEGSGGLTMEPAYIIGSTKPMTVFLPAGAPR